MGSVAPRVTLFVPVLNEIDGMKAILPQVRPKWCHQILVVDGGSSHRHISRMAPLVVLLAGAMVAYATVVCYGRSPEEVAGVT
jgi:hypothetical protein